MRAELARRNGEIDRARAAIDDTIDRIEYCSDDLARITAAAAAGLRVEGDAGQLARDRQDAAAEQHARERADALIARTRLSADSAGPVEEAELATAEAEYARATDSAAPPTLWARAAAAWESLDRPYPVAYARWREAEALMTRRDRDRAAEAASDALARARKVGSAWLIEEIESLAARARLELGEGAPAAAPRRRLERRRGRRPVRPHTARARSARPGRLRRNEPRDRRAAPHGGDTASVHVPASSRRLTDLPHRGGRGEAPPGSADTALIGRFFGLGRAFRPADDGIEGDRPLFLKNVENRGSPSIAYYTDKTTNPPPDPPPQCRRSPEPSACADATVVPTTACEHS